MAKPEWMARAPGQHIVRLMPWIMILGGLLAMVAILLH
jgi:hypothetical protein